MRIHFAIPESAENERRKIERYYSWLLTYTARGMEKTSCWDSPSKSP